MRVPATESKHQHTNECGRDLLPRPAERVLLLYPPVYDTRFPWAHWQQPIGLLKLASFCHEIGAEARLLDALTHPQKLRMHRERVVTLDLDSIKVFKWRYGITRTSILLQMRTMAKEGWLPDRIYVEGDATFWWEGVKEVVTSARQCFPNAQVVVFGAYATHASEHLRLNVDPDAILSSTCPDLITLPTDFSLYEHKPSSAYITFGEGYRSPEAIVDEIVAKKVRWGVRNFAFVEHTIVSHFPELYQAVLDLLATRSIKVRFFALGNIFARDIAENAELPRLLRKAGYKQLYFADDRHTPESTEADEQLIADYSQAAQNCQDAGYSPRSDDLIAAISLGRPGERLEGRTRLATQVAHHLGSLIFWPYQPLPKECPEGPLELQNGKLFPFRHCNGYTYKEYLHLMGLGVVFNSKHRTKTFDFLGDGLIETLFRQSLGREAWDPDPAVKGSLRLPMAKRNNE